MHTSTIFNKTLAYFHMKQFTEMVTKVIVIVPVDNVAYVKYLQLPLKACRQNVQEVW